MRILYKLHLEEAVEARLVVGQVDLLDEPLAAPRAPVARLLTLVAEKNWTSDVNLQGGNSIKFMLRKT